MNKHLFADQLSRSVYCDFPPRRIISLVPSQTELLFDLGLDEEIVAVTKFCIHPADKTRSKIKIGGTKTVNIEKIIQLNPDLIIGNKEENERSQLETLAQKFPVWISDIYKLEDALEMIARVGELVGKEQSAKSMAEEIDMKFSSLLSAPSPLLHAPCSLPSAPRPLRIAYFIWKNPYMIAGTNTFINSIINLSGWQNAFITPRYPEVSPDEIQQAQPDIILLSSEPYPFKEKHIRAFREICPDTPVLIVDGELFSWYGSRLQYVPAYLQLLKDQIQSIMFK